ncbi:hypothetical protein HDU67_007049 [Dinochytrium kinnereticum]|nr:hypothetical protein HDU67_007049 [Dinochytrium kinnereticum]
MTASTEPPATAGPSALPSPASAPVSTGDDASPPTLPRGPPPPYVPPPAFATTPTTIPMEDRNHRTLLLFVHGFFGSEASFGTFPADLVHSLRRPPYDLRGLECRMLPTYDCKGDIGKAVNHLLTMNAAAPEYDSVVILAHSMGGLLAVDAFRKLYDSDREWLPPKDLPKKLQKDKSITSSSTSISSSSSWFGFWGEKKVDVQLKGDTAKEGDEKKAEVEKEKERADGKLKEEGNEEKNGKVDREAEAAIPVEPTEKYATDLSWEDQSPPPISGLAKQPFQYHTDSAPSNSFLPEVNIISIITFDSPFFGLHPSVYTSAAPTRAASIITPFMASMPSLPSIPSMPSMPSMPSLPTLPTASETFKSASETVASVPAAAYRAASWGGSASSAAAASAAEGTRSAVSTAASVVTMIPAAAAEGAATMARGASSAVSYGSAVAGQAAVATLRAGAAVVHQASSFTASKVAGVAEAVAPSSGSTAESVLTSRMTNAAIQALPTVAIAGAAAAVSAVPSAIGFAATVVPRITWGRMAFAGASAMVAATVVGAKVIQDKEKEKVEELRYLVEEVHTREGRREGDEEEEDIGKRVMRASGEEAGVGETTPAPEGEDVTLLFYESQVAESDPAVTFESPNGTDATPMAETAGMETATLIAAAALAHAVQNSGIAEGDIEVDAKPSIPPTSSDYSDDASEALNRADSINPKAGSILRKASASLLRATQGGATASVPIDGVVDEVRGTTCPEAVLSKSGASEKDDAASATLVVAPSPATLSDAAEATNAAAPTASSSWMPWLTVGLAGAAIAAGTYYTGGLLLAAPLVQSVAVTWAASHVNEASKHLQFLYPLWGETQEDWRRRVEVLQGEVGMGRLTFRCFFVELPPLPTPMPEAKAVPVKGDMKAVPVGDASKPASQQTIISGEATPLNSNNESIPDAIQVTKPDVKKGDEKNEGPVNLHATEGTMSDESTVDEKKGKEKNEQPVNEPVNQTSSSKSTKAPITMEESTHRTFINPPPQELCHLFHPQSSDCEDVIAAHMMMFERSVNPGGYWPMVDRTGAVVSRAVKTWRRVVGAPGSADHRRRVKVGVLAI